MINLLLSQKENILSALDAFWKGMLGIFIVIGIIAVTVYFLNKAINKAQVKITERKNLTEKIDSQSITEDEK